MAIAVNKFAVSYSEIIYLATHSFLKFLKDSPVLAGSLPKLYSYS